MRVIKNNLYLLKNIYQFDKKIFFWTICQVLIASLKNIISVIFIKCALDCVLVYKSVKYLAIFVLIERVISMLLTYFECVIQWQKYPMSIITIQERLSKLLYKKATEIELCKLDNPEFYDKLNRAVSEGKQRPGALLDTVQNFLTSIITFVTLVPLVIKLEWKLIYVIFLSAFLGVFIGVLVSKLNYRMNKERTRAKRKIDYVRKVFYLPQYKEEMKLNDFKSLLLKKLDDNIEHYNTVTKRYSMGISSLETIKSWQVLVCNFGITSLLIGNKIISGNMEISSFTSLIYACTVLSNALVMIASVVPQLIEHSMFIGDLREILDYKSSMCSRKEKNTSFDVNILKSLTLKNVSFKYVNNQDYNIKNVSLKIQAGEKVAFVGENGAGKSTLIRLLLRLYDPQCGDLYINEYNYKDIDVNLLRNTISVVHQDFQALGFTIGENIVTDEVNEDVEKERITSALRKGGLINKVYGLPMGIDTPITCEFEENGIELSGGESQKLAIARAIYKDANILIMDEPMSSLDPRSEQNIYERMIELGKDKTLVLISHRLYLTRMVDRIYYMEKGEIVEQGSHKELMKLNGKYAALYKIQAQQYEREIK